MLNAITGAALFGNFYYHHQELIKSLLRLKEKEQRPVLTEKDDFDLPKDWELKIKENLNKIVTESEKKPEIKITDNKLYRGEVKKIQGEKVPTGKGMMETLNDKRKYIGIFQGGDLNGEGGIVDPSGSRTIGNFKNGNLDGLGMLQNYYEKTYKGNFKDGKPCGKGRWIFKDESFCITDTADEENITAKCYEKSNELYYEGDYNNYTYTGKGKFYYENGESYEGELSEGNIEGYGIRRDKHGDELYQGQFLNNQFVGRLQNREVAGYITIGVLNILMSIILKK